MKSDNLKFEKKSLIYRYLGYDVIKTENENTLPLVLEIGFSFDHCIRIFANFIYGNKLSNKLDICNYSEFLSLFTDLENIAHKKDGAYYRISNNFHLLKKNEISNSEESAFPLISNAFGIIVDTKYLETKELYPPENVYFPIYNFKELLLIMRSFFLDTIKENN